MPFTQGHALLIGVGNRSGDISAFSLYEHVFAAVTATVSELYKLQQEPELIVLKGVGLFAVALYRGASALGDFTSSQPLPQMAAVREVTAEHSQRMFDRHIAPFGGMNFGLGNRIDVAGSIVGGSIDTDGGAYVGGKVIDRIQGK